MVAWRQELIVNERCSQDEEGKLSKTGDFMVVFISGVSSKKKSEGRKKKNRTVLFLLKGVGMWRNGMKTPTRKLLTWYLVNFLWYHYAMLGTKLILNYVKAHHGVKKSFFTHSPSILFSVFQDLETTAQGMNQVRLKVDIKHVWAKSPALNKLHKFYTACGAGCKKRVFTFLKWVWRHLVYRLGDFTRLVGCFRLIHLHWFMLPN